MKFEDLDDTDLRLLDALQRNTAVSNQSLARRLHISPPTCLRRVRRLRAGGWIDSEVALLDPVRLGPLLTAVIEVSLDRQDAGSVESFELRVAPDDAVQQCYRVSPGPDFVLIVTVRDMAAYQALAQRLFTSDANVRNVKAFFSLHRAKFTPRMPLPGPARPETR